MCSGSLESTCTRTGRSWSETFETSTSPLGFIIIRHNYAIPHPTRSLVGYIQHVFLLDAIPWKPTHLDTYAPKSSPPHPQISDKLAHHETRRVCYECMDMVCVVLLKGPCVYTEVANSLPALSYLCSQSSFYPSSAPYSRYNTYCAAIQPRPPSDIFTTSNHATTT